MITNPGRKILAIPYFVLGLDEFVFGELGLVFDIYGFKHSVSCTIGHFTPSGFKSLGLKVYAKELSP